MNFRKLRKNSAFKLITISLATFAVWFTARLTVAQVFRPVPVTVKYAVAALQADGSSKLSEANLAIRSDGSQVEPRVVMTPDGEVHEQKTVVDLNVGKRIVVEGITQSLITYVLSDRTIKSYQFPSGVCDGAQDDGSIIGHRVVRRETPLMANERMVQYWYAPELGCLPLREVFSKVDAKGTTTELYRKEATQVLFGEPDPSLFAIPSWPERTPSQLLAEAERKYGLQPHNPHTLERKDRAYHAQQSRRP